MRFDKRDKVVKAPNGLNNPFYELTKAVVKAAKIKNSLIGTKEEVLAKAAKMNAKNRHFIMPTDNKAHYTDHLIQGQYHCVEIDIEKTRCKNAILFVFGGGMISEKIKLDSVYKQFGQIHAAQLQEHILIIIRSKCEFIKIYLCMLTKKSAFFMFVIDNNTKISLYH